METTIYPIPGGTEARTPFGRITVHATCCGSAYGEWVHLSGLPEELREWSMHAGASWPCSVLARCTGEVEATFHRGDLVDLEHPGADDVPGNELTAWAHAVAFRAAQASPTFRAFLDSQAGR